MSRALGPRPSVWHSSAAAGWMVLAACWLPVVVLWVVWSCARVAAALSGGTVMPFGVRFAVALARWDTAVLWPRTSTALVVLLVVVVVVGTAGVASGIWQRVAARLPDPTDPVAALTDNPGLDALAAGPSARKAVALRRSLTGTAPEPDDIGLVLGDVLRPGGRPGETLYTSWEDTVVAFMAPRSGKTTTQSIPHVLSAPGPVIATSNKADLWAAISAVRAERTGGRIWLFDPQRITYQPQAWWWNPLAGLRTVEDAHRLAGHFVLTVDDGQKKDLWGPAAQDLLCALCLAAAGSGRSLHHVAAWLDEPAVPTPVELLMDAGFALMASSLKGTQNGAVETRDGIYQTARTAAKCLRDDEILAWVTPCDLPVFDPDAFAATRDTLYLLSKSLSAAAPLIAALTDTAMRAAERRAERSGGRLDPPLVVALDEAANICRIADLPQLYSHLGSRGIVPVTILQSYEQGVTVWGEPGMAALWGAATRKLIGAGIDSPRLVRDLATLVGQHDVPVRSVTYGGDGRASEQISLRRQEILEASDIRALPAGTALLLATGTRPALVRLRPWYAGPSADRINAAIRDADVAIADGAMRHNRSTDE
ncbi:type IV secretory system conjugative DNA transfer family protein [Actinomadura rayongensis]|uniref:TraM recognition domain-containing protein n=1 Tax=Actinomadura rayongensis TaxID=1429076 RepID=A0A6I4W2U0_9ACTN|nr:TraM recognition domain-containing protein [Actinomadura rayongensis]MXQ64939.1 TraM recognition domain-containing protein [Actinomadura rayongensis]